MLVAISMRRKKMSKQTQIKNQIAARLMELTISAYLNLPYEGFQKAFDEIMDIWILLELKKNDV